MQIVKKQNHRSDGRELTQETVHLVFHALLRGDFGIGEHVRQGGVGSRRDGSDLQIPSWRRPLEQARGAFCGVGPNKAL